MASRGIVFIFCCFLSVSTALRCYLGDQLFQGSMLLRESLSLTDCPNTRFCVRNVCAPLSKHISENNVWLMSAYPKTTLEYSERRWMCVLRGLRSRCSHWNCPQMANQRQEITSSDLKTVNYLCDQATDIHGNYVVACQSEGTHSSTTSNNFPSVNMCCSSDLCNLNASNSSNSPLYRFVMVLLLLLYSFLL